MLVRGVEFYFRTGDSITSTGDLDENRVVDDSVQEIRRDDDCGAHLGPGALADWQVVGAIELIGRAHEGLRTTLEGMSEKGFKEALYHFVFDEGGEIDQVRELREPWREQWEWHYDLRLTISDVPLYVETRLFPESRSSRADPIVFIVQIKPA